MPIKCIDQIAPPPIDMAATTSHANAPRPVVAARRALCSPVNEPNTAITKDNATKDGSNEVTVVAMPGIGGIAVIAIEISHQSPSPRILGQTPIRNGQIMH